MPRLAAVVLVYNAEWSLGGMVKYLAERFREGSACALCEITYSGVAKKGDWKDCESRLAVPVREAYINQLSGGLADAVDGAFPSVVGELADGRFVRLLGPTELNALPREPEALFDALQAVLSDRGITT